MEDVNNPSLSIMKLMAHVLQISPDDMTESDSFFELGGTSLSASLVIHTIFQTFKVMIPVSIMFSRPDAASLATYVEQQKDKQKLGPQANDLEYVDLEGESKLPADIDPRLCAQDAAKLSPHSEMTVLLTGATGFLGGFMLAHLLKHYPNMKFVLTVRAKDSEKAFERVKENFIKYQLEWNPEATNFKQRASFICVDLRAKWFGMAEEEFVALSNKIDVVMHAAADVSYVKPYHSERDGSVGNVTSTIEILRLACTGERKKHLHYVSTLAVFGACKVLGGWQEVHESDTIDHTDGYIAYEMAYTKSKWVAEQLVHKTRALGLPVAVYRTGFIQSAQSTGASNLGDFLCRFIKGCIQMQCFPNYPHKTWESIPVDFCAHAICHIAFEHNLREETYAAAFHTPAYHLLPRKQINTVEMFEYMQQEFGFALEKVDSSVWHASLEAWYERRDTSLELFPLAEFITSKRYWQRNTILDIHAWTPYTTCREVEKALVGSGIDIPDYTRASLQHQVQQFVRMGFLTLPKKPVAAANHARTSSNGGAPNALKRLTQSSKRPQGIQT